MKIISIDPSMHSSGIAYWEGKTLYRTKTIIVPSKYKNFMACLEMTRKVREEVRGIVFDYCAFEYQIKRWHDRASMQNLLNLHAVCIACISTIESKKYIGYTPSMWKGSLPKKVSHMRIKNKYEDYFTINKTNNYLLLRYLF